VLALCIGSAAGYFVSHPLPLTRLLSETIHKPAISLIGGWLTSYDRIAVASAVISALPTILLLGLGIGLLLGRISYQRLLMYAILLWPLWFYFSRLLAGRAAAGNELDLNANFFAYSLLYLLIVATDRLTRTKPPPPAGAR
jgi:hypothetical protein